MKPSICDQYIVVVNESVETGAVTMLSYLQVNVNRVIPNGGGPHALLPSNCIERVVSNKVVIIRSLRMTCGYKRLVIYGGVTIRVVSNKAVIIRPLRVSCGCKRVVLNGGVPIRVLCLSF